MPSLAENLKPPFYAAIINEDARHKTFDDEITPTDEMVSLAPSQPGFLGLETTWDKSGKWVTVSYWTDIQSEKAWEERGDNEIRKHFNGQALKEACVIRVSKIDHKIGPDKSLRAGMPAIPESSMAASISAFALSAFPAIANLLRHEAI